MDSNLLFSDNNFEIMQENTKKKKEFHCSYEGCIKIFNTKWALTRHSRIHYGIKPFQCHVEGCPKSFVESSALKRHITSHSKNKLFQCPNLCCKKSFKSREYLHFHNREHGRATAYPCLFLGCYKTFCSSKTQKQHFKKYHIENNSLYSKQDREIELIDPMQNDCSLNKDKNCDILKCRIYLEELKEINNQLNDIIHNCGKNCLQCPQKNNKNDYQMNFSTPYGLDYPYDMMDM